jgi:hypothetical protein
LLQVLPALPRKQKQKKKRRREHRNTDGQPVLHLEFYFIPKFSLLNEISFQTGKHNHSDSSALNKKFFKYKAELRFYLYEGIRGTPYFALQFITARRSFDIGKKGKYYERNLNDSLFAFDKASVNSPYQALSIQFGATRRMAENFYFESSIGYGMRFVNTEYASIVNLKKVSDKALLRIRPLSTYRYIGRIARSQFNFGFRIFYCF